MIPTLNNDLFEKIISVSKLLNIRPIWLANVINIETGGTFSPSIKNRAGSGATGLIQFMPRTAVRLGTTVDQLAKMTAVKQMDFVYKYLKPFAGKMKSQRDVYLAVFYPSAINKPDSFVFPFTARGVLQNKGLDINKDGKITLAEFTTWMNRKINAAINPGKKSGKTKPLPFVILALVLFVALSRS